MTYMGKHGDQRTQIKVAEVDHPQSLHITC